MHSNALFRLTFLIYSDVSVDNNVTITDVSTLIASAKRVSRNLFVSGTDRDKCNVGLSNHIAQLIDREIPDAGKM